MKVVLSWLRDYIDLADVALQELSERWTLAGLEVAGVERVGDWWDPDLILVGAVVRVEPHPDADRLVLAWVDHGADSPRRVVTGAPNLLHLREAGDLAKPLKVAIALEGAELIDGYQEGQVRARLKGRAVRGIPSDAMVCSEKELGLSDDHTGILLLEPDAPVGRPLAEVLGDAVVDIDLTANLARAMSMIGVARETAAILDRPYRLPSIALGEAAGRTEDLVEVEIEAPDLCPRYTARVVREVEIGPSPGWMARRLALAGMRPINNIVDITNYVMLEWGQPLHAFDLDRLVTRARGGKPRITVRRARPGERMTTLDDVDRALDPDTLLICDDAGPVAIAGVMGGADSEVTEATRTVLIEAAAFDFINVRRTSKAQKLPSESSARFGRGVHPALAEPGSKRAAALLVELAGGRFVGGAIDAYPRPPAPVVVDLGVSEIARVLGTSLPMDRARSILEGLEFEVEDLADGGLRARVPDHRMDVDGPADLLEEIARIHGYDRLPSTLLATGLPAQRDNARLQAEESARDALVVAGLQEIVSYRLVAVEREALLLPDRQVEDDAYVRLSNPISPERSALRRSILTGLLEAAVANLRYVDRVALFELGPVFHARGASLPDEPRRLGLLLAGPAEEPSWRGGPPRSLDFYDAKGAVETLLAHLAVRDVIWRPDPHPSMHPGRTAAIMAGGAHLGHVGELHPRVLQHWGLEDRVVAAADLDLDALQAATVSGTTIAPFSAFPPVHQDLAVVIDDARTAAEVAEVIRAAGGPLLVGLDLFDVYRGPQVGPGRKSLAWSLCFQAADRTLESRDADKARARIVGALQARLGADIRQ